MYNQSSRGEWAVNIGESVAEFFIEKNKKTNKSENSASNRFNDLEKKYNLPEGMLDKLWKIESNRGQKMVSDKGATGHFQFIPDTAKAYGLSREDTFDLGKSSNAAAMMLSDLLKQYKGDVTKSLIAYNWGSGNYEKYGKNGLPLETQKYLSQYYGNDMTGSSLNAQSVMRTINNTSEVSIQNMNITSNATDSVGLTKNIGESLKNHSLIGSAITGNE